MSVDPKAYRNGDLFAKKISWVIVLLVEENPGKFTWSDIAKRCGWFENMYDRRGIEDAIWNLCETGVLKMRPDSRLELA